MALTSRDDLRTIYREAKGGAVDKVIHELDHHCVNFLAKSPFMVLSTADENGVVDGSPKGGEPGFARVLADGRVGWADSSGNNRLDSFENVVINPSVAMLFMIPSLNETLRINGTARLRDEAEFVDPASYRAHYEGAAARIAARLDQGVADQLVRPGENEVRAWALMGMNVFIGLRYGVWEDSRPSEEIAAAVEDLLRNGIAAPTKKRS